MTMDLVDFGKYVDSQHWVFAKTMYRNPHWYICRKKETTPAEERRKFEEAVIFIRKNGKPAVFYGRTYIYLQYQKHSYWTMGDPVEQTYILNRAFKNLKRQDYNLVQKELFYKEEPFLKENEELKKIMLHFIGSKENVDILEVGATNDFFKKELLKHKNISSYTTLNLDYFSGVDIIKDINEYTTDKKYDLVFFSFTVDNYIKELQLNKYKKLLKDDGVLVFISAKNVRDVLTKKNDAGITII